MDDPSPLCGTWGTKTGGSVGSETGLMVGLWERLRVRWAKVGETGEDVGVFRRTKVEMGMFADDSGSSTCLCRDSAPSFKAEGLWRGEVLVYEGVLVTKRQSEGVNTYPAGEFRVGSIVGERGGTPSVGMGLGHTLLG